MSCTISTCRNFEPRWTSYRARFPISGSCPRKQEVSKFFAQNSAGSDTHSCAVRSLSRTKLTTKLGYRSRVDSVSRAWRERKTERELSHDVDVMAFIEGE